MNFAFLMPRPVGAPPRASVSSAPRACLQLQDVLAHVAQRAAPQDTPSLLARLLEVVDACTQMIAARRGLTLALDVQEQIEGLAELARGREQAHSLRPERPRALHAPRAEAQERAACALANWRRVGQRFARLTGLLPTQLPHDLDWPTAPVTAPLPHRVLDAAANAQALSALHQDRWASAQCRCQRAARLVRSASAGRQQAQRDWLMGQGHHAALAQAWLSELDARGVLLQAQAERAAAHAALGLSCGAPALPL